jgi:Skp family chaperone for outer membrane proteins
MEMIASEAQPVIASAYKDRNCGLLLDRTNVLGGNLANDLTVAVVQGLDAKITTINVQRETVAPAPAATPAR